jgi:uncharacterized protein (DUF1778 family)
MAKRKPEEPAQPTRPDEPERKRVVKVRLSTEELRQVRMAAAAEDLRLGDFARRSVVSAAEAIIRKYLPGKAP